MKGIVLKIVCYVAVLFSFAPWPETSASSGPKTTRITIPPMTAFNPAGTSCEGVKCPSNRFCAVNENNKAACICDVSCSGNVHSLVCGSDNKTYSNSCQVKRKACMTNSNLTVMYDGECRYEGSKCNGITCSPNKVCAVAGDRAICVCNQTCSTYIDRVCGTDNQTYINDCELRKHACLTNKNIAIDYDGVCKQASACDGFSCPIGTYCAIDQRKRPVCVCIDKCPPATDIICGTDGQTYGSECELYREACTSGTGIEVAYKGYCLNGSVCSGFRRCPKNKQCNVNQDNKPVCVCNQFCSSEYDPVCGSDGVTYNNLCHLEKQACTSGTNLTMVRKGQCSYDAYCNGVVCPYPKTCEVNAKNQTSCVCNNDCGNNYEPVCGSDNKTYDNLCWFDYAACQGNLSTDYHSDVCSIGSGCQGIYCPDGQHCDSLRQSKPKCVCNTVCPKTYSPVCGSNNKSYSNPCELQKDACLTNITIDTRFNGRCEDGPGCSKTYCEYGRVCALDERNQPMCVCSQDCAPGSSEVCGSDGKTYTNECFLTVAACLTNKTIAVQSFGPCIKAIQCKGVACSSERRCRIDQKGRRPICVCNDQCNARGGFPICGSDNKTYSSLCELQKKTCISNSDIDWIYYGACVEVSVCDKISCPPDKRCVIDDNNRPTCVCKDQCLNNPDPNVQDLVCGSNGLTYRSECDMQKAACLSNRNITTKHKGRCEGLTCSDIACPPNRVCALNEKNQSTCVCNTFCPFYYGSTSVCGTDGKTYTNICSLSREACTKNKDIQFDSSGPCTNDESSTTTNKPCVGPSCTTKRTTLTP